MKIRLPIWIVWLLCHIFGVHLKTFTTLGGDVFCSYCRQCVGKEIS